jgi:hypothetical protein
LGWDDEAEEKWYGGGSCGGCEYVLHSIGLDGMETRVFANCLLKYRQLTQELLLKEPKIFFFSCF